MTVQAAPGLREVTTDGKMRLHFHPGQLRTWQSEKRFVFMLAGSQSGKSSFAPHWLHREIVRAKEKLADPSQGVGDFLAVASTYDQFKLTMLPELKAVFEYNGG